MCEAFEIISPLNWRVSKTITNQGHTALAAEGAITKRTRLFHLFASKMALTEEYRH